MFVAAALVGGGALYMHQSTTAALAAVKARTGTVSLANRTAVVVGGTSGSGFFGSCTVLAIVSSTFLRNLQESVKALLCG